MKKAILRAMYRSGKAHRRKKLVKIKEVEGRKDPRALTGVETMSIQWSGRHTSIDL